MAALLHGASLMVPVPAPELPVLDLSVMADLRSLNAPDEPDVFTEVARQFLTDVPTDLSALRAAIAAGSAESVRQLAHHLKGSALAIGALRMAPLCDAIEQAAGAGSLEHTAARAESLDREFTATRVALEQAIRSSP